MKLYKLSILALALAGVFAACDDKDTYEPGALSAGAYFSNKLPSTQALDEGSTTITIPVNRTSDESAQTVNLTVEDPSGLFTVPTSVSFAAGSKTADIVVGYDVSKLEYDTYYPLTFTIGSDQATIYGNTKYTVKVAVKSPMITQRTYATYYYSMGLISIPYQDELPTEISYSETSPNIKTYTISEWCNDAEPIVITVDENDVDEYGNYICHFKQTNTGIPYEYNGDDYWISIYEVYEESGQNENYRDASFFNPLTGQFSLCLIYGIDHGLYFTDPGYEYIQLDGYPDFSVGVEYAGLFTNPNGQMFAIGSVTVGPDCDDAIVANIAGEDVDSALADIVSGSIPTQTLGPGNDQEVRFQIPEAGKYTLVAISRGGGELQSIAYATYKVAGASSGGGEIDNKDWNSLGYAPFVDGWVVPLFNVDPFDLIDQFYVEVQQHKTQPEWLRLVNPYQSPLFEGANENTDNAVVLINVANPQCAFIVPQYSGFSMTVDDMPWSDWFIADIAGYYYDPDEWDALTETIIANGYNTTYEDDILQVKVPFFGGNTEADCKYSWQTEDGEIAYPSEIYICDAVSPQAAKPAIAKTNARRSLIQVVPSITGKYAQFGAFKKSAKATKVNVKGVKQMLTPRALDQQKTMRVYNIGKRMR